MFAVILSGCSKDGKGESVVSSGILIKLYKEGKITKENALFYATNKDIMEKKLG